MNVHCSFSALLEDQSFPYKVLPLPSLCAPPEETRALCETRCIYRIQRCLHACNSATRSTRHPPGAWQLVPEVPSSQASFVFTYRMIHDFTNLAQKRALDQFDLGRYRDFKYWRQHERRGCIWKRTPQPSPPQLHSASQRRKGSEIIYPRWDSQLVFQEAADGDLYDLLEESPRQPDFEDDEAFFLPFCGLMSAIDQLHHYTDDDLDIRLISCHHDLKPRNVLVDGPRFLLADFGLSETRNSEMRVHGEPDADRDLYFDSLE